MAHLFAEAFYDDPLYLYMFPDDTTRIEVLELFFRTYLDIYGKYGDIVTTSEDLTAIAYIYYEERFENKLLYYKDLFLATFRLIDFLRFISLKDIRRMIKTVKRMSSNWIDEVVQGNYIHLDLLAVQRDYRGLGKAKQLIEYVINEAQVKNLPLTLETQNLDNTEIYKHFNFETVEEISYEHMVQYCMLHK
ncbi:MAG: GNAT family N-acetyltransferase [Candidatus Niameybacter stercoravium]|nr:GNAT family N-acetyltransferase [Candidatus Niameybacter stercoravium]